MIHVAPCSCELHVRIRELEAKLATKKWQESWQSRAEKAEARVAELERQLDPNYSVGGPDDAELDAEQERLHPQEDEDEARAGPCADCGEAFSEQWPNSHDCMVNLREKVRELTDHLRFGHSCNDDMSDYLGITEAREREAKPAPAIEGHEREAD